MIIDIGVIMMSKMSAVGYPQEEPNGVRIQFSANIPFEPLQMMVENCTTGACGCACAADVESITVEKTAQGPQIHVKGSRVSVTSITHAMEECEAPDAIVRPNNPLDGSTDDTR